MKVNYTNSGLMNALFLRSCLDLKLQLLNGTAIYGLSSGKLITFSWSEEPIQCNC